MAERATARQILLSRASLMLGSSSGGGCLMRWTTPSRHLRPLTSFPGLPYEVAPFSLLDIVSAERRLVYGVRS